MMHTEGMHACSEHLYAESLVQSCGTDMLLSPSLLV